ncbi:MAG: FAD-dependent oxidoreductase, partial [Solirubrobacterales bacterium]|nr:FAD-dependent oxidoreductase [Solirubrobacterales bacterium]
MLPSWETGATLVGVSDAQDGLNRRALLGAAAATGIAAALPREAQASTRKTTTKRSRLPRTAEVVVVGGGFSGLVAALRLQDAGKDVVLLEASTRTGGRVLNEDIGDGQVAEAGGTYVGPTQNRILALGEELGVPTFKAYAKGDNVYIKADGSATRYQGTIPPLDGLTLADAALLQENLNAMAAATPVDAPWEAEKAGEWDRQTLDSWLRQNSRDPAALIRVLEAYLHPTFGGNAQDVSLLFVSWYLAGAGDERNVGTFDRSAGSENAAQDSRFVGGSQLISDIMEKRLGRRLFLRAPVRRIRQRGSRVEVVCDKGEIRCRKVIVAVPPTLAAAIDWDPILPPERAFLLARTPMGRLMKCDAIYDTPFWRSDGLSGMGVAETGAVRTSFDCSPPDGSKGVILGFVGGSGWDVASGMPPERRKQLVLENFARIYGPQALKPAGYFEQDWTRERWIGGGPTGVGVPGALTQFGHWIRKPHGRVHW